MLVLDAAALDDIELLFLRHRPTHVNEHGSVIEQLRECVDVSRCHPTPLLMREADDFLLWACMYRRRARFGRRASARCLACRPCAQDLVKNPLRIARLLRIDFGFDDLDDIDELGFCEPNIQTHVEVRPQLRLEPGECCQRTDRGDFSTLIVEIVAAKDVAEEVRTQELIDDRHELRVPSDSRPAGYASPYLATQIQAPLVRRQGARFLTGW